MPTPIPAAGIIQGVAGLATSAIGLINAGKTKREAERLAASRPDYEISPLVDQDLSLAQSELANGMSNAAERAYKDLDNGQFSSSIGAILKSGGGANSIGAIYGNSQDGRLKLAQMEDQFRLRKMDTYLRQSERKQQEEQTQWQVNEYAPWADKAQANAQARQNAQSQIWGGIGTFASGAMNGANAIQEGNKLNVPIVMNPNNPNMNSRGMYVPDAVPNYASNNFANTNTVTPMQIPTFNP